MSGLEGKPRKEVTDNTHNVLPVRESTEAFTQSVDTDAKEAPSLLRA